MSQHPSGYSSLRRGRLSIPGQPYLVTFTTRGRRPFFIDLWTCRAAVRAFTHARVMGHARLVCWVLMPDHAHLLLIPGDDGTLASVVQRIKATVTRNIRELYNAPGFAWAAGFHDRAIRSDESVRAVARYVIANPVRAGLVDDVGQYPHWDAEWLAVPGTPPLPD